MKIQSEFMMKNLVVLNLKESSDKNLWRDYKRKHYWCDIREFPISINTLEKVLLSDSRKSLNFDIFILISIANKSKFNAEDYSFEVGVDDKIIEQLWILIRIFKFISDLWLDC